MTVYIQANSKGMPFNINAFSAMKGFEQMGMETILFSSLEELREVPLSGLVVGGVGRVKAFLEQRGVIVADIDYPEQLNGFYGRRIWPSTTSRLLAQNPAQPVFVKPRKGKLFNGFVYTSGRDLIGRISPNQNLEIYCSDVLAIEEEWRCFVKYGRILDVRRYTGKIGLTYDYRMVQRMVDQYSECPAGYALDIGATERGETVIVEVNDGYSLGSYGLDPLLYAKLLSARWSELTGGVDECDF